MLPKNIFPCYGHGLRDTHAIARPFTDVLEKLGIVKKPGGLLVKLVKYWRSNPWKEDYYQVIILIMRKLDIKI